MRDVVIIGGGLSGLVAAYELDKLGISYTLIEVKPRLGGSIQTSIEGDFIVDCNAFVVKESADWSLLDELDMRDALVSLGNGDAIFKEGTQTLVDALTARLSGARLMRMAVSSVGQHEGRYTICLENGLLLDAGSLIIASPARFAERMFYGYIPEVSDRLRDFHYDTILRISLGYRRGDIPKPPIALYPDLLYAFALWTEYPHRVLQDHVLIQIGIRLTPEQRDANKIIEHITAAHQWSAKPIMKRIDYWAEADPLSCYDDHHRETIDAIQELLPDGIVLIGNDYSCAHPPHKGVIRLDDRIRQGREAAQKMAAQINR